MPLSDALINVDAGPSISLRDDNMSKEEVNSSLCLTLIPGWEFRRIAFAGNFSARFWLIKNRFGSPVLLALLMEI